MKTRVLIIIGICVVVITTITFGANFMSERNNQRELLLDQSSIARDSISISKEGQKYEYLVLKCLALFHCDISSDTFQSCIDAKKNGVTIEQLCTESNIAIDDGCTNVEFPDGAWIASCD
jgi:hypothetical protein